MPPATLPGCIKDVRVGPSPMWLRKYLHGAGMRSINNVVDITNFVMLETGHPMHAFDLDMVEGHHIIVRRAVEGEHITTLDGKPHPLTPGQLVICDAQQALLSGGHHGRRGKRDHRKDPHDDARMRGIRPCVHPCDQPQSGHSHRVLRSV